MCWWDWAGVALLVVQTLALLGLVHLNLKNRRTAKSALRKVKEIGKHASKVHRMVNDAVGEPPPPMVMEDPEPSLPSDLEKPVDK